MDLSPLSITARRPSTCCGTRRRKSTACFPPRSFSTTSTSLGRRSPSSTISSMRCSIPPPTASRAVSRSRCCDGNLPASPPVTGPPAARSTTTSTRSPVSSATSTTATSRCRARPAPARPTPDPTSSPACSPRASASGSAPSATARSTTCSKPPSGSLLATVGRYRRSPVAARSPHHLSTVSTTPRATPRQPTRSTGSSQGPRGASPAWPCAPTPSTSC